MASQLLELDDLGFDDRGDAVAAGAHAGAVDLVAAIDDDEVPDHVAFDFRGQVQFLAEAVQQDLHVLDDRVTFALVLEGGLLGAFHVVLEHVEHLPQAGRLAFLDRAG